MKVLFLAFLISFSALADSASLGGVYKIDQVHSKIVCFEKSIAMKGVIEIKKEFSESKLSVEAKDVSFESMEFTGNLESFEVRGVLTHQGVSSNVTLKGRYFGMINNELGKKAAFNFFNSDLNLKIFAAKPSDTTTALFREVQEIVE